jgi:hypothetical protein
MMSGGEGGRGGRVGQKVLSKPSADSFAVGRRQKTVNKSREKKQEKTPSDLIFFTVFLQ